MSVLDSLAGLSDDVAAGMLVFARVSALFVSAPIVGGSYAPWQAKATLALAVTMVLTPTLDHQLPEGAANGVVYGVALVREAGLGLALGFFVDLFFHAVRFGGDLMGRNAGYAAAESFDPGTEVMSGPIGDLFHIAVVLLFLLTGGHHIILLALADSFQMVPQINILHITFATKIMTMMILLYIGIPAAVAFLGSILLGAEHVLQQVLPLMGG